MHGGRGAWNAHLHGPGPTATPSPTPAERLNVVGLRSLKTNIPRRQRRRRHSPECVFRCGIPGRVRRKKAPATTPSLGPRVPGHRASCEARGQHWWAASWRKCRDAPAAGSKKKWTDVGGWRVEGGREEERERAHVARRAKMAGMRLVGSLGRPRVESVSRNARPCALGVVDLIQFCPSQKSSQQKLTASLSLAPSATSVSGSRLPFASKPPGSNIQRPAIRRVGTGHDLSSQHVMWDWPWALGEI